VHCGTLAQPSGFYAPTMTADDPVTDDELDQLSRLSQAASPAPWESFIEGRNMSSGSDFIRLGAADQSQPDMYVFHEARPAPAADLDFIAAARNCVPRLIAEVRRLRDQP
jgi:hypothetical protein